MSTKTKTPNKSLAEQLASDCDYAAAVDEVARLTAERAKRQTSLDQLQSELGDLGELVAKIESGDQLSADDAADKVQILRDQIQAFTIAIGRAEQNRTRVLRRLSAEISEPFRAQHAARIQRLAEALQIVAEETELLREIPSELQRAGLEVDHRFFPLRHLSTLVELRPRLKYLANDLILKGEN